MSAAIRARLLRSPGLAMATFLVAALYKFEPLPDFEALRAPLRTRCEAAGVRGTLLLASEGINGTIAGPPAGVLAVLEWLRSDPRLADLEHKESWSDDIPFASLKVRLKKEIVSLRQPGIDPRAEVGTYVPPAEWNELIQRPDVLLVDTRNDYEVELGSFEGAVDPGTGSFSELPGWLARQELDRRTPVAMFCTGGIRCEKATAYLLQQGFENVFHLQGGILKYLEEIPEAESLWRGECYVFDQRVTVDHQLARGRHVFCVECGRGVERCESEAHAGLCRHCRTSAPVG